MFRTLVLFNLICAINTTILLVVLLIRDYSENYYIILTILKR